MTGSNLPSLSDQLHRLRVIDALRVMIVLVLCVWVAVLLDLTTGLAVLAPVLVMKFFIYDESLVAGLQLIGGTLIGMVFALIAVDLLLDARPFYLAVNLLAILGLAYWAGQAIRGRWPMPFAAVFAMLCITTSAFAAIGGPTPADQAAVNWFTETVIGTLVAWVVLIGLWPSPRPGDLARLCPAIERDCAQLLRQLAERVAQGRPVTYLPSRLSLMFFGDLLHQVDTLKWRLARSRPSHAWLRNRLIALSLLYVSVRYMARTLENLESLGPDTATREALVTVTEALATQLEGAPAADLGPAWAVIEQRNRDLAAAPGDPESGRRLSVKLAAFSTSARELIADLAALEQPAAQTVVTPPSAAPARLEPDSLKAAFKMTFGVLLALSLHFFSGLPAGAYLVVGLVIVLVQPNLGRSHLRVRLWIPGVAAGTAYSLLGLGLITMVPHFGLLLAWLALGFLVGGYVAAGPIRIAYAGVQICLGMAVILAMAAFPIASVVTAEERVIGALLGFLIALLVGHLVWPEHPATQLRANFAKNLRALPGALAAVGRGEDPDPAATRTQLRQLKLDLQTDFGLLYDFSYMFTRQVRPAYDYRAIAHASGAVFIQILSLYEALVLIHDPEQRARMVAPLQQCQARLAQIAEGLAGRIEQGQLGPSPEITAGLAALDPALGAEPSLAGLDQDGRRRVRFGLNVVREIRHELANISAGLATAQGAAAPRTAVLAQTYEGAG